MRIKKVVQTLVPEHVETEENEQSLGDCNNNVARLFESKPDLKIIVLGFANTSKTYTRLPGPDPVDEDEDEEEEDIED